MVMKRISILLLAASGLCTNMVAEVRRPAMPRGLTADKSPQALPRKREEKKRNLVHKRKGLQGYKEHYTFSDLYFDELAQAKDDLLKSKNYSGACKYLKRMIMLCDESNKKAGLMIELADLLFAEQSFDDAAKWYSDFAQLYPGHKQAEYASYRAVVCASKNILGTDRDQSPTEKTLELAQNFLKRDIFTTHRRAVKQIEQQCYQCLAASDMQVAAFYIKQGDYAAAQKRIGIIRDEWAGKTPEVNIELAKLEVTLAEVHPDFKISNETIKLAQAATPGQKKVDMTTRF